MTKIFLLFENYTSFQSFFIPADHSLMSFLAATYTEPGQLPGDDYMAQATSPCRQSGFKR